MASFGKTQLPSSDTLQSCPKCRSTTFWVGEGHGGGLRGNREAFCNEHESKHNPTAPTLCLRLSWQMLTLLKVWHRWRETTRQTHFMRQMSSLLLEWESKSKSEGADGGARSFTASALPPLNYTHSRWDGEMANSGVISRLPFGARWQVESLAPDTFTSLLNVRSKFLTDL